ncbi:MAG: hypothetical protein MUF49_14210 [Oculatellaceae cyanobacterium Prado106]|jgi:hypothetical protein|nr:hypothetical protein [Oculatellaceae cyanobacterium Prado106]
MNLEQMLEKVKTFPPEEQQRVIQMIAALEEEIQHREARPSWERMSALEAARQVLSFVGDGPADLSTNEAYWEGYGLDSISQNIGNG